MKTTLFEIKAVRTKRKLRYPSFKESVDVKSAQRRLFSPLTIALAGIGTLGLAASAPGADEEVMGKKVNPKKLTALLDAALGRYPESKIKPAPIPKKGDLNRLIIFGAGQTNYSEVPSPVKANPPLTRVSIINKIVMKGLVAAGAPFVKRTPTGVLDIKLARETTFKLFELYGVKLKKDQMFKKTGVDFEADGYHPGKKIGFEITHFGGKFGAAQERKNTEKDLVPQEWNKLSKYIKAGKANILVLDEGHFTSGNVTPYLAMNAYLKSVVSYLEWLRKAGKL